MHHYTPRMQSTWWAAFRCFMSCRLWGGGEISIMSLNSYTSTVQAGNISKCIHLLNMTSRSGTRGDYSDLSTTGSGADFTFQTKMSHCGFGLVHMETICCPLSNKLKILCDSEEELITRCPACALYTVHIAEIVSNTNTVPVLILSIKSGMNKTLLTKKTSAAVCKLWIKSVAPLLHDAVHAHELHGVWSNFSGIHERSGVLHSGTVQSVG